MSIPGSVRTRAAGGLIVALAVITAGLVVSPSTVLGTVESLSTDPLLFGLVIVGLYAVRPLLAWPTTPLSVVVGYGYGIALGVPIALAGVIGTVVPVFLAVRWFAADDGPGRTTETGVEKSNAGGAIERLLERTGNVVTQYYDTAGPIRGVVASRLAPIPSDVSTCAAAVSGIRLRHFVVGTALGELPWTIAAVVVGTSAATITTNGLGELGLALTIACVLAALILLAGPASRALRTRTSSG